VDRSRDRVSRHTRHRARGTRRGVVASLGGFFAVLGLLGAEALVALPAGAVTPIRYVAQGGSDTGTCTSQAAPCATVTYALSQASSGDTIEVSGTIDDNVTVSKSVTISGAHALASSPPVVDGNNTGTVLTVDAGVTVTLDHLSIESGLHFNDGGIFNGGTLTVNDSTIWDNFATGGSYAGGIMNNNTLTVTGSTIADNMAGYGGGLYNAGVATVTDSTISGNTATGGGSGGGIFNNGTLTLTASTISGNTATGAGGGIQDVGSVTAASTIVAGNTSGTGDNNCNLNASTSVGYNLTNDPTGAACGFTTATDVLNKDPMLGALAQNGGPTESMLPSSASPAAGVIPSGTTVNSVSVCPGTDQRGAPRPYPPATKCSIGAVEAIQLGGYYEAASDGGIFAFDSPFLGSMGGKPLNKPIVGMAVDPATGGYYEVASDGGIFAFDAPFLGSMGGKPLNKPIVGMAVDPASGGYYEVASDGGIFAFDAPFEGSMGGVPLNAPIAGMAVDSLTGGYRFVASDGGIFAFQSPFYGSMGGKPLNKPIVGMDATSP